MNRFCITQTEVSCAARSYSRHTLARTAVLPAADQPSASPPPHSNPPHSRASEPSSASPSPSSPDSPRFAQAAKTNTSSRVEQSLGHVLGRQRQKERRHISQPFASQEPHSEANIRANPKANQSFTNGHISILQSTIMCKVEKCVFCGGHKSLM